MELNCSSSEKEEMEAIIRRIKSKTPLERQDSLYYRTSDDSFLEMELMCSQQEDDIPVLNDTLEEVNFLLKQSEKLKQKNNNNLAVIDIISPLKCSTPKSESSNVGVSQETHSSAKKKHSETFTVSNPNNTFDLSTSSCYRTHIFVNSNSSPISSSPLSKVN